nr:MAG TPA: hypothetical protein [Caudoviricetes sp.]
MGAIGGSLGMPGRNVSLAEMRGFFVFSLIISRLRNSDHGS